MSNQPAASLSAMPRKIFPKIFSKSCDCVLHIQPMMVIFPQSNATQTRTRKRTMITTEQLNAVAAMIGTTDKNLVFTACIKTLVAAGMDVKLAMEFVLGKNNVDSMISDLYDGLRAQA